MYTVLGKGDKMSIENNKLDKKDYASLYNKTKINVQCEGSIMCSLIAKADSSSLSCNAPLMNSSFESSPFPS